MGERLAERLAEGAEVFKTDFGEAIPLGVVADNGLPGERLHNAYSLIYNDFVTSVMRDSGKERPVVWSRSTWAGGQRHVGQWAGDPNSSWQDLASTLRAGLSMALSGHSFWSHDIGGFHGRPARSSTSDGANSGSFRQCPGSTVRRRGCHGTMVKVRLQLCEQCCNSGTRCTPTFMPLLLSMSMTGCPSCGRWCMSTPMTRPHRRADLQFFLGPDLLVAPLYRSGGTRPVWFPPGEWVHYQNGQVTEGGYCQVSLATDVAPLWLRAGSSVLLTHPGRRIGDGLYEDLSHKCHRCYNAASSAPKAAHLNVPSYGEAAIVIAPTSDNGVDISVAPGLPKLDVAVLGGGPISACPSEGRNCGAAGR